MVCIPAIPGLTARLFTYNWDFLVKQSSVYSVGTLWKRVSSSTRGGLTFITGLKLLRSTLLRFFARGLWINSTGIGERIGKDGRKGWKERMEGGHSWCAHGTVTKGFPEGEGLGQRHACTLWHSSHCVESSLWAGPNWKGMQWGFIHPAWGAERGWCPPGSVYGYVCVFEVK